MTLPTYFVCHGGGPWPYMKREYGGAYDRLEASLADMPRQLGARPAAVLVISGHWEAPELTAMASPRPPMLYDYYGFPEHTYRVRYPAAGSPALARRVQELLAGAGFEAGLDAARGYDHGAFVPLSVIFPEADVPVIQLSLKRGLDPATHLAAGAALAPLREEGVLILGSGMSYHNLMRMGPNAHAPSREFDEWLAETMLESPPAERHARLLRWSEAPSARACHPREEHLIPLMVAVGAAGDEPATRVYHEEDLLGSLVVSSYRLGG
ncbi:MAG TPA: class III extradiol ring-cleavage dioxygenase [Gammaproteobacteria bacterium]|nr:class III extradiol ring-cleavage dioxygenase [Gammaproteobacteria bacterium]